MAKMKRAVAPRRTQVASGAVQKAVSQANGSGTWANSRLPINPALRMKSKSQGSRES